MPKLLLTLLTLLPTPQAPTPLTPPAPNTPLAGFFSSPEVRLRKMHLVRPDLIPYPILHDTYC